MSTNLNQRKKRGGATWTEEFYTKGKKLGQKVPGFGMSKAQFTKEGVPRKARKTRSKIGEVDKEAKERELVGLMNWDAEIIDDNTRSVGHSDRGLHLQFKDTHVRTGYGDVLPDQVKAINDLGLTKRGKIRVQATGHRRVGKQPKKETFTYQEPDSPINEVNPLLAALSWEPPASQKVKKKKFKINKKVATPTPSKPKIAPKPKVKRVFFFKKKKDGKTTFTKKYKVGNTLF
jgi:hypothetical protein